MGSAEICWPDSSEKKNCRKRPWTSQEDMVLLRFVSVYGEGRWDAIAKASGLKRKGKSCRLRWFNYLRPDLNRTRITADEEQVIKDLHERWGNRWSLIARYLPGRTDNQIKNYFRNHIKKKKSMKNSVDKEIQPSDSSTETQNNCNIYDYLDETQTTTGKLGNVIESDLSETNVLGFNEDGRPPVDTISCSTDALYASDRELFVDHYCDDQLWKYNQSEVSHTIEHNYENTDKLFL